MLISEGKQDLIDIINHPKTLVRQISIHSDNDMMGVLTNRISIELSLTGPNLHSDIFENHEKRDYSIAEEEWDEYIQHSGR